MNNNPKTFSRLTAVLLLAILTIGALDTWWMVRRADRDMRERLLGQTRLVAQTVNIERIKALSGTEADLDKPEYLRLKEQLALAKQANDKCRFIYFMGRKDDVPAGNRVKRSGQIFFFVDNEPVGSEDESPAGQVYDEVSDDLRCVFDTRVAVVKGPVTDRWGTWVTGLAPLTDQQTGKLLAVLGMDIDARTWKWDMAHAALPPVLLTLALIAILVTCSVLMARRSRYAGTAPRWMQGLEPAVAVAVGLVLTLFGAWTAHERAFYNRTESFEHLAASKTDGIAKAMRDLRDIELEGLAHFYEGSKNVTADEFQHYTQYLRQNPAIYAWEWIPAVAAADKSRFEQEARAAGLTDFEIWQKDAQGKRLPASGQDVYYPVFRVTPLAGHERALGYDLGSEPLLRTALKEAVRTGLSSATDPIIIGQKTDSERGMLVYRPVFDGSEPKRLCGFVLAVLQMENLLKISTPDKFASMELFLLRKDAAPESLTSSSDIDYASVSGPSMTRPIFAFGKAFSVTAQAGPNFMRLHPARAGWLTCLTGLLLTAALAIVVSAVLRRREELEQLVTKRTTALADSEKRFRSLYETTGDAIMMLDEKGFFACNPKALSIFGVATEEAFCSMHPTDLSPVRQPDGADSMTAAKERIETAMTEGSHRFEWVHKRRDTEKEFPAEVLLSTMELDGKQVLQATVRDVTKRKKAEAARKKEKQRLSDVLKGTNVGSWEWNVQTGETIFNERWAEIIGYTLEEISPTTIETWMKFAHPDDLEESAILLNKHFSGESDYYQYESRMRHKNGSWIWVLDRGKVATWTKDGKPLFVSGTHQDITARKQAEKELLETNRELEAATARANEMAVQAEMANIAKSEFLANMSHEIRTPMNGVIGMTSLLLGSELSDEQREFTEIIRNSGDSLLSIINNILDYSKIEAGKIELENIDFDLRIALDEVTDLVALKAHEKGLEYVAMVHPEVPSLLCGDPGRLRQILINLVGNATKFTEKGEVTIRISLEDEDSTHATIRFRVADTGIGIPQERMDRLFQSFSQVDSSTTRKFGGTGLGLTISKQLAKLMGGQIGVESEEGKGSTFWFTAVLEKQPEGREEKIVVPGNIKDGRILIVDDNATNRYVLREQLKLWGCRHGEASSGMQALEELRLAADSKDPYKIAILDMQMPEMDGETLGQKIKQDPELKNTIIVMMTSLGQRGNARQLKEIGFAAYLTKPVKQSQLYDCLATVTGMQKQAAKGQPAKIVTRHSLSEDQKRRVRILLAEDNIVNQKVATSILGKLGYRADAVADGREAVEALSMIPYDIVLMDCQMPQMDGYEATEEIRKPESKALDHKVPVIAMTANAMKGDRDKCIEAGMDDYLSKPVKPQELSDMLEKWLCKQDSSQQKVSS